MLLCAVITPTTGSSRTAGKLIKMRRRIPFLSEENEEILSRRGFFKKATRKTLPIMALIVFEGSACCAKASSQYVVGQFSSHPYSHGISCTECEDLCLYTCYTSCEGDCIIECANTCIGNCDGTCVVCCAEDCMGHCSSSCVRSCVRVCFDNCMENCYKECRNTCYNGCKTLISMLRK